jgi:cytosine/adenosine deaminase-related metal-dependent hydrolase
MVRDGAVMVSGSRIRAVASARDLCAAYPGTPVERLDGAILAPGFVDTHCHLEWALAGGLAPGGEFGRWLGGFLAAVGGAGPEFTAAAAEAGALAALRAGTTTLWDSGPTGAGAAAMARVGLTGISCVEVFGSGGPETVANARERLLGGLRRADDVDDGRVEIGIAPHAPYTVGPDLWMALIADHDLARRAWTTHLAESDAELTAIRGEGGPIAEAFAGRYGPPAVWPGPDDAGVVTRLARRGALRSRMIAAHCVRLDAGEADLLAEAGVSVAHCPTSNAYLGCGVASIPELRNAGVRVGLGTDSPASAGNYDIRAEARACGLVQGAAGHHLTSADLVRLATLGGAEALFRDHEIGTITAGKRAHLVAIRPPAHLAGADPHRALLDAEAAVSDVWVDGVRRVERSTVCGVDVAAVAARGIEARSAVC